jgi:adenosylcobinamide kinase/adenosylcobinamide-phosphate guanylyltransferase
MPSFSAKGVKPVSKELTLITGGVRSGKSAFAVRLAERSGDHVLFLATMAPGDDEGRRRIRRHQEDRPAHWQTAEESLAVPEALLEWGRHFDTVILDCLTLWVTSLMEAAGLLATRDSALGPSEMDRGEEAMAGRVDDLLAAYREQPSSLIVVTNEVGAGLVPSYSSGRLFRDLLGLANQRLAAEADTVYCLLAGLPLIVKGPGGMMRPETS